MSATWVPGDPLHGRGEYAGYLFNFRETRAAEECHCDDAASWPDPKAWQRVDGRDDIRGRL
ncbi:MAG: hypothetical protein ACR2JO_07910 [Mycobacteriales bacterium]